MKKKKTEKDFLAWLYGAKFYNGTTRYRQFPGHHVFVTKYDTDDDLRDLVDDLEGGDNEAIAAGEKLARLKEKGDIRLEFDDNPSKAMEKLVEKMRVYYFDVLNKEEI